MTDFYGRLLFMWYYPPWNLRAHFRGAARSHAFLAAGGLLVIIGAYLALA